jgi:hypothetical protein
MQAKVADRDEIRLARAAEKQLRQDIQLSQKGNQRRGKAPAPPPGVSKDLTAVDAGISSILDVVPTSAPTTRTRNVRLPERYRI